MVSCQKNKILTCRKADKETIKIQAL